MTPMIILYHIYVLGNRLLDGKTLQYISYLQNFPLIENNLICQFSYIYIEVVYTFFVFMVFIYQILFKILENLQHDFKLLYPQLWMYYRDLCNNINIFQLSTNLQD